MTFFDLRGTIYIYSILLYAKVEIFMYRKYSPILEKEPFIFYEDLYFASRTGKVLARRQGSDRNIDNILKLLSEKELDFVRANMLFSSIHPLLLVKSTAGAMLIDFSLYISKKMFMVIIPNLPEEKLLPICKEELSLKVLPSPSMKESLDAIEVTELDDEQRAFLKNINVLLSANALYDARGLSNVEIVDLISEISQNISTYIGSEIDFRVKELSSFKIKNEINLRSLRCMLIALCFAIRNYSADRSGEVIIEFCEYGVILHINFEMADEFLDLGLDANSLAPEFRYLMRDLTYDHISCVLKKEENKVFATGFLWDIPVEDQYIKKDNARLKYTKE